MEFIVVCEAKVFTMSPLGPETPVGPCRVEKEPINESQVGAFHVRRGVKGGEVVLGGIKTSFVLSSPSEQEVFLSCRRLLAAARLWNARLCSRGCNILVLVMRFSGRANNANSSPGDV